MNVTEETLDIIAMMALSLARHAAAPGEPLELAELPDEAKRAEMRAGVRHVVEAMVTLGWTEPRPPEAAPVPVPTPEPAPPAGSWAQGMGPGQGTIGKCAGCGGQLRHAPTCPRLAAA